VREWFVWHLNPEELAQWFPALLDLVDQQLLRWHALLDLLIVPLEGRMAYPRSSNLLSNSLSQIISTIIRRARFIPLALGMTRLAT
jgi:hypothetical protein